MKWTKDKLIKFEEEVEYAFKDGLINCPVHLSGGNEEALISLFDSIEKKDYVFSTHRCHYHYLLKGGDPNALMDELQGLKTGCCKGKARSMHIIDESINFYASGIVAGMVAPAAGVGLALKKQDRRKKSKRHVWCFVGDGAEDSGHYIEAVRFCNLRALPVTFIVEDNDIAVESTKANRWRQYQPIKGRNVIRYSYKRRYPHVGVGKHVSF